MITTMNDPNDIITISSSSGMNYTSVSSATISASKSPQELLDERELNLLVVEHKMQEQEILKLKDNLPDYADHIKDQIANHTAKQIVKKMSFTKKKLPDEDVHHFIGRVYVFTREELIQLIEDARNAR